MDLKKIRKKFKPIFHHLIKKLKTLYVESILLVAALLIAIFTVIENQKLIKTQSLIAQSTSHTIVNTEAPIQIQTEISKPIKVDISGAIENPGIYEASEGARLGEIIAKAGGLTYEADALFVGRNFNYSRILSDQDKIYIPYKFEIALRTFIEEDQRILSYLPPKGVSSVTPSPIKNAVEPAPSYLISINNATLNELDTLPNIGPTTGQKIIDNRPYEDLIELTERKVVSISTWDKIKDFITL